MDIMEMLFSQEEIWEMERKRIANESEKKGMQKGIQEGRQKGIQEGEQRSAKFYKEFMQKMRVLNRVDEMFDAMDDTTKLEALAKQLGIEYPSWKC